MAELAAEHRAKAEAGGSEDAAPNHEVAVLELMAAYPLAPRHGGER